MAKRKQKAAAKQPSAAEKTVGSTGKKNHPGMANLRPPWKPGESGNPGGRPKIDQEIRELAQVDSPEAYEKIRAIMLNDKHRNQLPAAIAVLKLAGVSLTAGDGKSPPSPSTPLLGGKVPSAVDLEAVAGGPSGHLQ